MGASSLQLSEELGPVLLIYIEESTFDATFRTFDVKMVWKKVENITRLKLTQYGSHPKKETNLPTIRFQVRTVSFREGIPILYKYWLHKWEVPWIPSSIIKHQW